MNQLEIVLATERPEISHVRVSFLVFERKTGLDDGLFAARPTGSDQAVSKSGMENPRLTQLLSERIERSMQIVFLRQSPPEQSSILPPRERRVLNNWNTVLSREESRQNVSLFPDREG